MKKVLIFAGTTEGRELLELLSAAGIFCIASVATEYGSALLGSHENCRIVAGRKDAAQMLSWMQTEDLAAVVDATHPFATEVSANIKASAAKAGLPCLRLRRMTGGHMAGDENDVVYAADAAACLKLMEETEGNILLTTGSKELDRFITPKLKDRCYVRILPAEESIRQCRERGIARERLIAMQGPFSVELNEAILNQYRIAVMVTKESGAQGGFYEKLEAARAVGTRVIVIQNPETNLKTGRDDRVYDSVGELLADLEKLLQHHIEIPRNRTDIYLIGAGMGERGSLTEEALDAVRSADFIFGARRMLGASYVSENKTAAKLPYYRFSEILPYLKKMRGEETAVVLYSGDSGFYSGAANFLREWGAWGEKERSINVHVLPGISSLSYLAARANISWQDAKIFSLHGKDKPLLPVLLREKKVFLLTSGVEDMRKLGTLLEEWQLFDRRIVAGCQLASPEEQILTLTPRQCRELTVPGLYCCFILWGGGNAAWGMTPGFADEMFERSRVPMTKEEVREVSLCKLHLTKDAVLYDVGSGTGSIAVEAAFLSEDITVYAVEKKRRALEIIEKNCEKFSLSNIEIIEGEAPDILEKLPAPTHVFIGGSGGKLFEILGAVAKKARGVRVVVNAISLETVAKLQQLAKELPVTYIKIVQMQVCRAKEVGAYHLMQAENPVYICSFEIT